MIEEYVCHKKDWRLVARMLSEISNPKGGIVSEIIVEREP